VSGSILEYSEGLMGAGFQIKNPNAKSSCGCGSSFNT
jgi:iron-sulfur cluster assembly accessory protein